MSARVLPLSTFAFFVVYGMGVRVCYQVLKHRKIGVVLFHSGRFDQNLREAVFLAIGAVFALHAVAASLEPDWLAPVSIAPAELAWPLAVAGSTIVVIATLLVLAAQFGMGASWRVGIDEAQRPGLVTSGLYAFSRNPIYLFLLVAVLGFVLIVPTWISLAASGAAIVLVWLQVSAEEDYLARTYGEAYHAYARRVGRFFPFLGRER